VLLEVNTLPGMTPTSLFPDAAAAAGTPFPALVDALVRSAAARGARAM
jgi:D-alanine-D-alanine ligase